MPKGEPHQLALRRTINVYSACSCKMYYQMSRLHRILDTKWNVTLPVTVPAGPVPLAR